MATKIEEKMKDCILVVLDGNCFYKHKENDTVRVCANCAEDGKRYYLEYSSTVHIPGSTPHYILRCNRCKAKLSFKSDPSNATPVEDDAKT